MSNFSDVKKCHYLKENGLNNMPAEVLLNIFQNLESKELCHLRLANRRIKNIIDGSAKLDSKFATTKSSRFTISYNSDQEAFVLRSIKYGSKSSVKSLNFTSKDVQEGNYFDFIFRFLSISRLQFENIPKGFLDDNVMDYLLNHFLICRKFSITNLSFYKCDMRNLSSFAMKQILKYCRTNLKQFSLINIWNAREDTFTDEHIEILELSQITSLQITKISMKPGHKYLSITDSFFYQLISVDAFPALMLQLCLVSTTGLASYLKEWIKVHDSDSFSNLTCTLNECPALSKNDLINECENLPIQISNNNDCNISIFIEEHPMNIFCINFGKENSSKLNFSFHANPKSAKVLSCLK